MQINVLEYFEQGALKSSPDKVAVVDGDRSLTFRQLEQLAKSVATRIVRHVDVMREPVAVFLPKSGLALGVDLGIVYSGNMYMNLDVKAPPQRTRNIVDHIAPVAIITDADGSKALTGLGIAAERLIVVDNDVKEKYDNAAVLRRMELVLDLDPLCIINTSGSTGTPKGVALNHRGTIDFMDWAFGRFDLMTGDAVIGSLSPYHFDIYTLEVNFALAKGATLVLIPETLAAFPVRLMEFMVAQKISFIFWVPSIMVNISNQDLLEKFDLSALELVWFAGEVFPTKHLNRWRRALPGAMFVNLYGPIEASVDCTYYVLDREFGDDEPVPIGIPMRNTDVLILNESNREATGNEHGELCVRGCGLALGYYNDPEKTAKAFTQNPLNTRYPETIYRTGDTVYRNDRGEIMFVGRKDFQIKHMGYRIELTEIEHQILSIDGIANACVLYNKAAKAITLFYEARSDDITAAHIRTKLAEIFPKYMWPTVFVPMKELPRNPNGKIDRNGLASQLETPSS